MINYGYKTKIQYFIITFVSYISIHTLRTAYSSTKHFLPEALNTQKSLIGFADSVMLIGLGIGHFMHTLTPIQKPVKTLVYGMIACSLSYAAIPFCIDHSLNTLTNLIILMAINGFIQSYTWPNLLMIINEKWDKKKNTTALGFWATNGNFGNIIGFFICFQIGDLDLPWEDQMYLAAAFTFLCGIWVALRVQEVKSADHHKGTIQQQERDKKIKQQALKHMGIKAVFHEKTVIYLTAAFSLVKSVIYGIMLWLPLYFYDIGLGSYSFFIPMAYDVSSIVGSVILGYLFSKVQVKGKLLSPLMVILVICFFIMKYTHLSVSGYFVIVGVIGACLGGSFNTIAGLVVIQLTKVVPKQYETTCIGFYSALTMSIANITTALTQILIGFIVGKNEQQIFVIFMVYAFGALLCFLGEIVSQKEQFGKKQQKSD